MTFHGIVKQGAIKLPPGVELPEGTEVCVDVVYPEKSDQSGSAGPSLREQMLELTRKSRELVAPPDLTASVPASQLSDPSEEEPEDNYALNRELLKFAGIVKDLPPDLSVNHDHYLYGVPKRQ